jgi:DNA-binding response OmpR family regulator
MSTGARVLVVGQNLVFVPRVQAAARAVGGDVRLARSVDAFREAFRQTEPALVLVDLEGDRSTWMGVLEHVGRSEKSGARLVAFGPHEDLDAMETARRLGCDPVLTKGQFSRDLPGLVAEAAS